MYRHQRINIDATYRYDANGNNIHGDGRSLTYYTFDKPKSIIKGNHKVEFEYGPDRGRYYRKDTDTSTNRVTQTYYIGNVEKVSNPDGSQAWKRYLGNVIIEHKRNSAGVETHKKAFYSLKDHLGSLNVLLEKRSSTFVLKDTLEFDPWGQRRAVNWSLMAQSAIAGQYFHNTSISNALGSAAYQSVTSRGFTGHEMLDEVGIIHMNGRIYDPKLGRFLQADSSIDGVTSTQGYNRYSYVHNNPLNAIDPSGHFLEKRLRPFKHIIRKFFKAIGLEASQFLVAVGSAFCGLYAPVCAAAGSYDIARAYGTSSNEALRGAAIAGASAFVFTQIGSRFTSTQSGFWQVDGVGHIGAHALAGGVISVLQGGKFGHGFISAGLTKGLDVAGLTDFGGEGAGWVAARTAVAATAGGTISAATGGKFANGARTAAFGHLYNQERARARSNAQKGQWTHEYEMETEICSRSGSACTVGGVWGAVKNNSVPFQDGTLTHGAVSKIPGIGAVTTRVDDANYSLVNKTHANHLFKYGSVTRSLVITESTISVRTVGMGTNTNRYTQGANYAAYPYFKALDVNIKATIGVQQMKSDVKSFFD